MKKQLLIILSKNLIFIFTLFYSQVLYSQKTRISESAILEDAKIKGKNLRFINGKRLRVAVYFPVLMKLKNLYPSMKKA